MQIGMSVIACSFVYLMLLAIVYFQKERVNQFETKLYSVILVLNIIGLFLEFMCCITVNNIDIVPIQNVIVNRLYLIYFVSYITIFTMYVYYVSFNKGDSEKQNFKNSKNIMKYIFIIIYIVSLIFVITLPLYYFSGPNAVYSYGPATEFLTVLCAIYMIIDLYCMIKNFKNIKTKKNIPLFVLLFCFVIAFIVRNINPSIILINSSFALVTAIMYFTIENPDVNMIKQLTLAKDTADKANRAKSDFLSSMSHEIRTPLNAIVGFSECIKQSDDIEDARENANDVITASNTLLEIVNGILDISKIESGKLELVETNYNSRMLFSEVEKLVNVRIGDKPIEFKMNIAEDLPNSLYGDHLNIKKILINLLTNAVKYTEQGFVWLNVKCVKLNDEICRMIISVKDTGRGIKSENIDKLFTKFQRLDEDRNTTIEGTGLGLAITKQLVEMMNGKIVVNSIYGEGSEFTVAIDQRVSLNEAIIEEMDEISDLNLTGKTILIVDDNKLNLKVATKLIQKYNCNIDTCESGFECIDKINGGNKYDLILLDDMMPKMRGTETLTRLKQIDGFNIPVIILTANAVNGMKEHYLSYGFNDYLAKPIDKKELYNMLKKYIKSGINDTNRNEEKEKIEESDISPSNSINDDIKQNNINSETKVKEDIKYNDYSNKKIMIVDDNKMNIKIASRVMKPYNFQIDESFSGQECLEKVKENTYDLIFMDYMMPEMDGIETLHKLKENINFSTKVIALTADAVDGARERFLSEGFDEYVSKPIDISKLDKVINKLINTDTDNDSSMTNSTDKKYNDIPEELLDMSKPLSEIDVQLAQPYKKNEQFSPVYVTSSKDVVTNDYKDNIKYLKQNNIDIDTSLELLGDIEMYNDTLKEFLDNSNERLIKLNDYLKNCDMKNYAIEVHALKSDSKYLGFTKLAEISLEHELKSKENDFEFVQNNYSQLLDEFNRIIDITRKYR